MEHITAATRIPVVGFGLVLVVLGLLAREPWLRNTRVEDLAHLLAFTAGALAWTGRPAGFVRCVIVTGLVVAAVERKERHAEPTADGR